MADRQRKGKEKVSEEEYVESSRARRRRRTGTSGGEQSNPYAGSSGAPHIGENVGFFAPVSSQAHGHADQYINPYAGSSGSLHIGENVGSSAPTSSQAHGQGHQHGLTTSDHNLLGQASAMACPTCGNNVSSRDRFCHLCYTDLSLGRRQPPQHQEQQGAERMMGSYGGRPLPLHIPVSRPTGQRAQVQCPTCHSALLSRNSTCYNCMRQEYPGVFAARVRPARSAPRRENTRGGVSREEPGPSIGQKLVQPLQLQQRQGYGGRAPDPSFRTATANNQVGNRDAIMKAIARANETALAAIGHQPLPLPQPQPQPQPQLQAHPVAPAHQALSGACLGCGNSEFAGVICPNCARALEELLKLSVERLWNQPAIANFVPCSSCNRRPAPMLVLPFWHACLCDVCILCARACPVCGRGALPRQPRAPGGGSSRF